MIVGVGYAWRFHHNVGTCCAWRFGHDHYYCWLWSAIRTVCWLANQHLSERIIGLLHSSCGIVEPLLLENHSTIIAHTKSGATICQRVEFLYQQVTGSNDQGRWANGFLNNSQGHSNDDWKSFAIPLMRPISVGHHWTKNPWSLVQRLGLGGTASTKLPTGDERRPPHHSGTSITWSWAVRDISEVRNLDKSI